MKSLLLLFLSFALSACSTVKIPPKRTPADFGMAVKFVKGSGESIPPKVVLVDSATGGSLAEGESVFTPDAVEVFGEPSGERFVVLASGSGKTVAVHENASDASPAHQITVFQNTGGDRWRTHSVGPPHIDDAMKWSYGTTGESLSIDDDYLYYRFGQEGPVNKTLLNSLSNW